MINFLKIKFSSNKIKFINIKDIQSITYSLVHNRPNLYLKTNETGYDFLDKNAEDLFKLLNDHLEVVEFTPIYNESNK